jgi:hypothetical protein
MTYADGIWFFDSEDLLQTIYMITPNTAVGNITFNFTAVTREDGTSASDNALFTVSVLPGPGNGTIVPYPPVMIVGTNVAVEDNSLRLNISLTTNPNETTSVIHSVVIYNLNSSLSLSGDVYFNPYTQAWVASKAALDAGNVTIRAPSDFSGTIKLEVQGVTLNNNFETNQTSVQTIDLVWTPDGDGPAISATAKSENLTASNLLEDKSFTVNVTMSEKDVDGSETIGDWVIIEFGAGFNVSWSFNFTGTYSWGPFFIDGVNIANGINISTALLNQLRILPFKDWHGQVPITIHGFTWEFLDPNEIGWAHSPFTFEVIAVADPALMFTSTVNVSEYTRTPITSLLSANRSDIVETNGKESISVKLINVPDGSQFFLPGQSTRYGGFVETGVYSIPDATKLPLLEYLGPEFVSGTFNVTLSAVTVESSNFDEYTTATNFMLIINAKASGFLLLSKDIPVNSTGVKQLDLNVRVLDMEGTTYPGEDPPEIIELFFNFTSATLDNAVYLRPTRGGSLLRTGNDTWTFRGTEDQANAIEVVNVGLSGAVDVGVTGLTRDMGTMSNISTDDFNFIATFAALTTPGESATVVGASKNGTAGNDFYLTTPGVNQTVTGGSGGNDIIFSSSGAKTMTGGLGADMFVWPNAASSSGLDIITDFSSAQGDILNLGGLVNFNTQTGNPADYVRLAASSTLEVRANGTTDPWVAIVVLNGVVSLDANALYDSGNLLL